MKRSNRLVLLVGVFLAIVAFVGILLLVRTPTGDGPAKAPTEGPVVVATTDGTGPADPTLVVDVDAPGGGASCTSPVGGGRSVSRVEPPLVPGEPQAAAVEVTMIATSTFHLCIVALPL